MSHYNEWHYHGREPGVVSESGECVVCGVEVRKKSRGPAPKYCSSQCRAATPEFRASRQRAAAARRARTAESRAEMRVECKICATTFSPERRVGQLYCSDECRSLAWSEARNPVRCSVAGCGRPHRATGLCSMHWRRKARAEGREKSPEWSDRRRANYQRRRAAKSTAESELIDSSTVYERDDWLCGICCGQVDRTLTYPDPLSASLDHILPLAKGGTHTYSNVQCAHLRCNIRKGASYPQEV